VHAITVVRFLPALPADIEPLADKIRTKKTGIIWNYLPPSFWRAFELLLSLVKSNKLKVNAEWVKKLTELTECSSIYDSHNLKSITF
jgi:hypothetical protein